MLKFSLDSKEFLLRAKIYLWLVLLHTAIINLIGDVKHSQTLMTFNSEGEKDAHLISFLSVDEKERIFVALSWTES